MRINQQSTNKAHTNVVLALQVLREGMGQATGVGADEALETVITNALILDHTGIYKADVGMKKGLISGLGKAGNPDVMEVIFVTSHFLSAVIYLKPTLPIPGGYLLTDSHEVLTISCSLPASWSRVPPLLC